MLSAAWQIAIPTRDLFRPEVRSVSEWRFRRWVPSSNQIFFFLGYFRATVTPSLTTMAHSMPRRMFQTIWRPLCFPCLEPWYIIRVAKMCQLASVDSSRWWCWRTRFMENHLKTRAQPSHVLSQRTAWAWLPRLHPDFVTIVLGFDLILTWGISSGICALYAASWRICRIQTGLRIVF